MEFFADSDRRMADNNNLFISGHKRDRIKILTEYAHWSQFAVDYFGNQNVTIWLPFETKLR